MRFLFMFGTMILVILLVISGIQPFDRITWAEVMPVLIVVPLLFATYKTFPLTSVV
jgi:putative membrane protein